MGNDSIASINDWFFHDGNAVTIALIVAFLFAIYYTIHLIK